MKITKKSSENLVISGGNSFNFFCIPVFRVGVCLIISLTPFINILIIESQQILKCTRIEANQVNCQVQEKTILQTNEKPPIQLTGAELIERKESGEDGSYKVYHIGLYSKTGEQDFGYIKPDKAELQKIVSQINLFLANSNQRILQLQQSNTEQNKFFDWIIIIAFSIFAIFWIHLLTGFSIFTPLNVTLNFDKKLHTFTLYRQYYFWIKIKNEYSLLSQISLLIGDNTRIYFIIDSKEKLEVPDWNISPKESIKIADEIQLFLNPNKENEKLILLRGSTETWTFDRSQHKLTIVNFLLPFLGEKGNVSTSISEYSLTQPSLQINSYTDTVTDSEGDSEAYTFYNLVLILNSEEKLRLYCSTNQKLTEQWRDVFTEFLKLNIENPEAT